ncbi:thiol-disulfide oxidoreductase DCC family protein [Erwinia sp. P6884]|uniref:thiol-disulfide oxidoreductase DCC family protein n=1 Tax=Erwinia sp. P6884 TaxID=3141450 RepID=UPI00319D661A
MSSVSPSSSGVERIVLYDGVCKLCNGWVRFLIRHDRDHTVRLAAVQTATGAELLKKVGMSPDNVNTIVLMEGDRTWFRAEAIFRVMDRLPWPWRLFSVLRWFPKAIGNRCYDLIASHRYRLFGRYDEQQQPEADHPGRFLEQEPEREGLRGS